MYVRTYMCVCVCTYVLMYICIYMYILIYIFIHTYIQSMRVYINIYTYIHSEYACTYAYIYIYIYIYIYTYIYNPHTYVSVFIQSCVRIVYVFRFCVPSECFRGYKCIHHLNAFVVINILYSLFSCGSLCLQHSDFPGLCLRV